MMRKLLDCISLELRFVRGPAVGLALCLLLGGCAPKPDPVDEQTGDDLRAIREELRMMRVELATLRDAVTEIHERTVLAGAPPSVPVVPARGADIILDDDDPVLGASSAAVVVVEFSDYECPFCRRFYDDTLPQLKARYIDTGKVKLVTRDFPLSFHAQAQRAAMAANCAMSQDAYWGMRDGLSANIRALSDEVFLKLATKLDLNIPAFAACLRDPAVSEEIASDHRYGTSLGVSGTPSFFIGRVENGKVINGRRIVGAQPFESFQAVIDPLL